MRPPLHGRGRALPAVLAVALLLAFRPPDARAQAEEWGTEDAASEAPADDAPVSAPHNPAAAAPQTGERTRPATSSTRLGGPGSPMGAIDVPPDPQDAVPGAVDYEAPAGGGGGGLVGTSDLGNPSEEAAERAADDASRPTYKGVIPGVRDNAEPQSRYTHHKRTFVTWIGYEPSADRVFIQTSRPAEYLVSKGPHGELVVELTDTSVATTNDTLPLDLTQFQTSASSVRVRRLGSSARVTISLREQSSYRLERKGRYIYVTFRT